jgi:hypothetical protein
MVAGLAYVWQGERRRKPAVQPLRGIEIVAGLSIPSRLVRREIGAGFSHPILGS